MLHVQTNQERKTDRDLDVAIALQAPKATANFDQAEIVRLKMLAEQRSQKSIDAI
jgi:hypothetical protein